MWPALVLWATHMWGPQNQHRAPYDTPTGLRSTHGIWSQVTVFVEPHDKGCPCVATGKQGPGQLGGTPKNQVLKFQILGPYIYYARARAKRSPAHPKSKENHTTNKEFR